MLTYLTGSQKVGVGGYILSVHQKLLLYPIPSGISRFQFLCQLQSIFSSSLERCVEGNLKLHPDSEGEGAVFN